MKKILLVVLLAVLIGGGIYWFVIRDEGPANSSAQKTENTSEDTTGSITTPSENTDLTIIYTNDGFSPETGTVASGQQILVQNNSSSTLDFASDDHPAHLDNSELNIGKIAPGESKIFMVTEKGTWGFHDHNNSANSGTLVVN